MATTTAAVGASEPVPLAAASEDALDSNNSSDSEDDKETDTRKSKRIIANRKSAQLSRIRKLEHMSELDKSVDNISKDLKQLLPQLQTMRTKYNQLVSKNKELRLYYTSLLRQSTPACGSGPPISQQATGPNVFLAAATSHDQQHLLRNPHKHYLADRPHSYSQPGNMRMLQPRHSMEDVLTTFLDDGSQPPTARTRSYDPGMLIQSVYDGMPTAHIGHPMQPLQQQQHSSTGMGPKSMALAGSRQPSPHELAAALSALPQPAHQHSYRSDRPQLLPVRGSGGPRSTTRSTSAVDLGARPSLVKNRLSVSGSVAGVVQRAAALYNGSSMPLGSSRMGAAPAAYDELLSIQPLHTGLGGASYLTSQGPFQLAADNNQKHQMMQMSQHNIPRSASFDYSDSGAPRLLVGLTDGNDSLAEEEMVPMDFLREVVLTPPETQQPSMQNPAATSRSAALLRSLNQPPLLEHVAVEGERMYAPSSPSPYTESQMRLKQQEEQRQLLLQQGQQQEQLSLQQEQERLLQQRQQQQQRQLQQAYQVGDVTGHFMSQYQQQLDQRGYVGRMQQHHNGTETSRMQRSQTSAGMASGRRSSGGGASVSGGASRSSDGCAAAMPCKIADMEMEVV